jgi:PPOX class F420-dependent enzyme/OxyR family protein
MATLTAAELAYLTGERRLGRVATADVAGRPQVTPVGMWSYNAELGTIDVSGHDFANTRKFRNVTSNPRAAIVIDDVASIEPWRPRAVHIEGSAEAIGPENPRAVHGRALIRITPERIVSWGLDG